MLIKPGFSPSVTSQSNTYSNRGRIVAPEQNESSANKPAAKATHQAKFEGVSVDNQGLGRAATSYQAQAQMKQPSVPVGQHIDIKV